MVGNLLQSISRDTALNVMRNFMKKPVLSLIFANLIAAGFLFFTASSFAETTSNEADWLYTVNQNDSFERIYQKYLVKRANILALSQHNKHKLTKKLQPGQVISIPVEMLKKIPVTVQILVVTGDVIVMTASGNDSRKANKDDLLSAGMLLQTSKNSLAKLRFADGSITDVQSNSSLSIQESFMIAGKATYVTQLKLVQGRTEIMANPAHVNGNRMQVETPSAVAAVRGTQFRVGAEGDVALQETLDGRVAFSAAGQEVLLDKGYGSAAEKNKAPSPPVVLPDAPDVTAFAKQIDSLPVEFNLAPQLDAVAWVSQLALDADFTQIVNEQVTLSLQADRPAKLSLGDLADGQYYLRLRVKEQHGLQGKDALHAFNVKVLPLIPKLPEPIFELIEPLDGAVIPLAPTELAWTPTSAAASYTVQIARDINFEDKVFESMATSSNLTLLQSFGSGEFYWRVVEMSQGKPQKFSKYRKFTR